MKRSTKLKALLYRNLMAEQGCEMTAEEAAVQYGHLLEFIRTAKRIPTSTLMTEVGKMEDTAHGEQLMDLILSTKERF